MINTYPINNLWFTKAIPLPHHSDYLTVFHAREQLHSLIPFSPYAILDNLSSPTPTHQHTHSPTSESPLSPTSENEQYHRHHVVSTT